jgi:hypothetical protein
LSRTHAIDNGVPIAIASGYSRDLFDVKAKIVDLKNIRRRACWNGALASTRRRIFATRHLSRGPTRPKLSCIRGVNALRGDTDAICRPTHAVLEHLTDTKLTTDLLHVHGWLLQVKLD